MTRAEVESLAERIVLATTPGAAIEFEGRAAWNAKHPGAARDREWIVGRYRELGKSLIWPETEQKAVRDWLTMVLAEACGVEG